MFYVLLLRQEAERYRALAKQAHEAHDDSAEAECDDLAETMDEVACEVEERENAG
jgi:hypothetical protein